MLFEIIFKKWHRFKCKHHWSGLACDWVQCISLTGVDCDVSLLSSQTVQDLILCEWQILAADCSACGFNCWWGNPPWENRGILLEGSVNESQMAVRESGCMRMEEKKKKSSKSREKMVCLIDITITTCWWLHVGVSHEIGHNVLHYCHYNQLRKVEGRMDCLTGRRMIDWQDDRLMKRQKMGQRGKETPLLDWKRIRFLTFTSQTWEHLEIVKILAFTYRRRLHTEGLKVQ